MTDNSQSSPVSLGTKLVYLLIVLLWIASALAIYVVFFSGESSAVVNEKPTPAEPAAKVDPPQKKIVLNAKGKVVDPEEFTLPVALPEFEFVNQAKETVGKKELLGKPWVGTFVFSTCPGPCSMITGRMRMLQQDMKRHDVNLVSITVNPETDTPERLTKYADAFSADTKNWHFLTGDRKEIYSLIQQGFKMPVGEIKPGDILHSNRFVVVDAEGNYVESFTGLNDDEFTKLKKKLRELSDPIADESAETDEDSTATE